MLPSALQPTLLARFLGTAVLSFRLLSISDLFIQMLPLQVKTNNSNEAKKLDCSLLLIQASFKFCLA